MTTYVMRNGKLVLKSEAVPIFPANPAAFVISDTMAPLKHMGTGRIIDSKAQFRADTRASGCIEIGNEVSRPAAPIKLDRGQRRDDIRRAIYELRNRQ